MLGGPKSVFRGLFFTPKLPLTNFDLESHLVLFLRQQALLTSLAGAHTIYSKPYIV